MLQQMEIKVGVPYKGNGVLNEYGQWTFTPSQVGSREGQKKLVVNDDNYTVYTTRKKVIIHMSIDRGERLHIMAVFCKLVEKLLEIFKDYDFRCVLSNKDKGQKDK